MYILEWVYVLIKKNLNFFGFFYLRNCFFLNLLVFVDNKLIIYKICVYDNYVFFFRYYILLYERVD